MNLNETFDSRFFKGLSVIAIIVIALAILLPRVEYSFYKSSVTNEKLTIDTGTQDSMSRSRIKIRKQILFTSEDPSSSEVERLVSLKTQEMFDTAFYQSLSPDKKRPLLYRQDDFSRSGKLHPHIQKYVERTVNGMSGERLIEHFKTTVESELSRFDSQKKRTDYETQREKNIRREALNLTIYFGMIELVESGELNDNALDNFKRQLDSSIR
jgi:hypothetical protein